MSTSRAVTASALWTLPNLISLCRIAAGPACIYRLTQGAPWAIWAALITMIFAEITDFLDGLVARAHGQISSVGKILDPMADSLYRVSVFLAFVANGWMPVWMLLIIIVRDITVSYLRIMAELRLETMAARQSGKWKAVVQSAAQISIVVVVALWGAGGEIFEGFALGALTVATAVTVYSLYDYTASVLRRLP
jgi:CDP-diacylglycerol--glycerol-3-phosphate 3-phosphatidyltransferase